MQTYFLQTLKQKIAEQIVAALRQVAIERGTDININVKDILNLIEKPKADYGDLALPCFHFVRQLKASPDFIAEKLKKRLEQVKPKYIAKIEQEKAYVNFFFDYTALLDAIEEISSKGYGSKQATKQLRVMIEYSSPNTNKPLHLGHLRNDCIGMALANLLEFYGYKVIKAMLLNDKGLPIFKVIAALELSKYKTPRQANMKPDHFVGWLYVLFEQQAKQNEQLIEKARKLMQKFESGDKHVVALWRKVNAWAWQGMKQTYNIIGSKFDVIFKESKFYKKANKYIEAGLKLGVFKQTEKGVEASLSNYGLPDKVVLRKDNTSVYITTDIALSIYKFEKFKLDKSIWVVANEQQLYFKQLFKILELLGYDWAKQDCIHLAYGLVLLHEGKMKSREGNVIDADQLIEEVKELAKQELAKRNVNVNGVVGKQRALSIALAAIKYYFLKVDCMKDVLFDKKAAIDFEGFTGPYLLYSYVRAKSIIKKGKINTKQILKQRSTTNQMEKQEKELLRLLLEFPDVVKDAATKLKPDILAIYAYKLAQCFNTFYAELPVLHADKSERIKRLKLVIAFTNVMRLCLKLLNLPIIDEM